jgi:PleD family two-component response regulator
MEDSQMTRENAGSAYYHKVKGLVVPAQAPESIDRDIENFVSTIGQHTERLETCFNSKDSGGFIGALEAIRAMLEPVFAKQCILYISALNSCAKIRGPDDCRQLFRQTTMDLLLLSIEMQKAKMLGDAYTAEYKQVEIHEEIARSFSVIGIIMALGDYEKARSMAADKAEVDAAFAKLAGMIASCRHDAAKELADAAEKEHIAKIQNMGEGHEVKTVLAVDDRPEILSFLSTALRGRYRVLGAPGGKIALEILARQKPTLFFLDIEMPEMDGFELAGKIRADSEHANTPIIFLTGNASNEYITKGINLGVNDFIIKPSNHVNLLVKARVHLDD